MKSKHVTLALAALLSFNTAFAQTQSATLSDARATELLNLAETNPDEVLSKISNEELLQSQKEIRQLVQDLQFDFAKAEARDNDKLGYRVRKWSARGAGTLALLTIGGIVIRSATFKGPSVDNDAQVFAIIGIPLTVAALAATAVGQGIVWLTPSEVTKVKEKIANLAALSNAIDEKLAN